MKRRDIPTLLTRIRADLAAGDLTNAALAAHMMDVTGGTDAAGAWSWRQAYDLVQAAAILADAADDRDGHPVTRLTRLTGAADARDRDPPLGDAGAAPAVLHAPALRARRRRGGRDPPRRRGAGALGRHRRARAHGAPRGRARRPQRAGPVPRGASARDVPDAAHPARRRAHRRPAAAGRPGRRRADEPALLLLRRPRGRSHHRAAPRAVGREAPRPRRAPRRASAAGGLRRAPARPLGAADGARRAPSAPRPAGPRLPEDGHEGGDRAARRRPSRRRHGAGPGVRPSRARRRSGGGAAAVRTRLPTRPARVPCAVPAPPAPARPVSVPPKRARRTAQTTSPARSSAPAPIAFAVHATPCTNEAISEVYARYVPQRIEIEGAVAHPSPLVESVAMAAVAPPVPSFAEGRGPALPPAIVETGALSAAQL